MRRSTLVFGLFFLMIAGIVGYNMFLRNQPPLEFTMAVDPIAETWVNALAKGFNARNVTDASGARLQIRVDATRNDVSVWQGRVNWTSDNHPLAWISTTGWIAEYAPNNLMFSIVEPSLATSPLVWGGFRSRVDIMTQNTLPFDWQTVRTTAAAERWDALGAPTNWGFVNMGIDWPPSSASGVNALATMLATYSDSAALSGATFSQAAFTTWFAPLKTATQTSERLGESPASAMGSRGLVVAGFALLPEFEWLGNLSALTQQEAMVFAYPLYQTSLDFPLSIWEDSKTTDAERQAVRAFADYVLSADGQKLTQQAGLRPTGVPLDATTGLFAQGAPYGLTATLPASTPVTFDRSIAEQLVRLME